MNGLHCHYKFCTYRFSDADPKFGEVEAHYQEFHGYACSNMSRRTTCHDCQIPFNTLKDLRDGFKLIFHSSIFLLVCTIQISCSPVIEEHYKTTLTKASLAPFTLPLISTLGSGKNLWDFA